MKIYFLILFLFHFIFNFNFFLTDKNIKKFIKF